MKLDLNAMKLDLNAIRRFTIKGAKTGGRNFKKGCAPGPGKPALSKSLKEFNRTNLEYFISIAGEQFLNELPELLATLISIAKDRTDRQCIKAQELLYDRLIGKSIPVVFDDEIQPVKPQIISLTIEELTKIAAPKSEN